MKVIGLTGGIASGKSTASALLAELGAKIIDADRIAREIVIPGSPALVEIREVFGQEVIDSSGALKRSELAKLVFNDPEKLQKLNSITHPRIIEQIQKQIEQLRAEKYPVIVDAALLIELDLTVLVDEVWLVWVDPETQLKRLTEREQMSSEDGAKIIAAQMSLNEKKKKATVCIDNNGNETDLKNQLTALWLNQEIE